MSLSTLLIDAAVVRREAQHAALRVGIVVAVAAVALQYLLSLRPLYLPRSLGLFLLAAALVLRALPHSHPHPRWGSANTLTLLRAGIVALLAGLIGEDVGFRSALSGAALALLATLLDGVDGWLARRSGLASAFGARFDMETDAAFVAVLSLLVWTGGRVGAWVLLSGAMRYLFALAARFVPRLRRPVPSSRRGKSIAVLQMLALIIALSPTTPAVAAVLIAAVALAALLLSFLLDVRWLLAAA